MGNYGAEQNPLKIPTAVFLFLDKIKKAAGTSVWQHPLAYRACITRVFSLNFDGGGGGNSKFSVPVGPRRGRSPMGGGGTCEKIRLKPKLPT